MQKDYFVLNLYFILYAGKKLCIEKVNELASKRKNTVDCFF